MKQRARVSAHAVMGQRLRELRCARGVSPIDLSRGLAYPGMPSSIELFERGEVDLVTLRFIARVSCLLMIHPASLFTQCDFPYQREFTTNELASHISGRIEVFRRMRNMHRTDLCKLASLSHAYVWELQRYNRGGSLSSLVKLAEVLDVPVWQLFI